MIEPCKTEKTDISQHDCFLWLIRSAYDKCLVIHSFDITRTFEVTRPFIDANGKVWGYDLVSTSCGLSPVCMI